MTTTNRKYIKLTFTGDIMCSKLQNEVSNYDDYSLIFSNIKKYFINSNYVCGNLETPLAGKDLGFTNHPTQFNTPDSFALALKETGFNLLTTANNHCLDRGIEGLKRTISVLEDMKIDHIGTYKDDSDNGVLFKNICGLKIAFLSYTYGTNSEYNNIILSQNEQYLVDLFKAQASFIKNDTLSIKPESGLIFKIKRLVKIMLPLKLRNIIRELLNPPKKLISILDCVSSNEIFDQKNDLYIDRLKNKIKLAKDNSDFVVMFMHSGGQYNSEIGDFTKNIVNLLTENGVNAIIGNHPHTVLASKFCNSTLFASYSLGNFCFTPFDGWYIDGVYADFSIILNLYIDSYDKTISKVTFSVIKIIRDKSDNSRVYLLYDLFNNENDIKKKKQMINSNTQVVNRFMNKKYDKVEIEFEHDYMKYVSLYQ